MTEVTNANARDRRKEFLVGALPHQLQLWLKPQDQLLVALQHHPQPRAQPAKLRPQATATEDRHLRKGQLLCLAISTTESPDSHRGLAGQLHALRSWCMKFDQAHLRSLFHLAPQMLLLKDEFATEDPFPYSLVSNISY
ncbi:hypothetical protein PGTUg99_000810 [Puccinia graminis f. sp. tritici]|uniref:Uncharacterized protein n=1 Tax=Puccinia graminis f. sp. tritici TaxID=56615 RepID=A0A5B0RWM7_PUCGR|nr:hypothetical protein PGTUg99_000810 [Puccinia graminis f. sp. tritici]